ncbi:MAG: ribosomal protein [Candidatus Saccharibacteria bacterium]|nr:ribosomal protein [Candidatus Saccharibacteria bacterium]
MKFNELDVKKNKQITRVGRGIAAGKGKTAGRGTKGQGARTGKKLRPGFEGGQTPLMQRLPKLRGFRSHHIKPEEVYTGQLEDLKGKNVDTAVLAEAGLISSPFVKVKLLVRGELTKAVTVNLPAASAQAIAAVESAGGSFNAASQVGRPKVREAKKA